jgi:hypothetical protein
MTASAGVRMYIVKTSVRAFLFALLPLLFVHGVLFAMALLGTQTTPPMIAMPSPDRAFGMLALRVALDAAGLVAGHFVCRGVGIGSRRAYAMIGAFAAIVGYAISVQQDLMLLPPYEGAMVTAGIFPALAGMVAGFLYGQFAGRESLLHTDFRPADDAAPTDMAPAGKAAPPLTFAGPIQVRTSMAAMFIASFLPALLVALVIFMASYGPISGISGSPDEPMRFVWSRQIMALALPAQMFLMAAIPTIIPCAIFVAIAHGVARALHRTSGLHYAGAGALVGLAFGLVLIPFGGWPSFPFTGVGFLILPLAATGAVMMAVYRRFAGIEPRSLPEPVLATEIEALVPEDHPSRHNHAVVLAG